jgi:hypothetical protein
MKRRTSPVSSSTRWAFFPIFGTMSSHFESGREEKSGYEWQRLQLATKTSRPISRDSFVESGHREWAASTVPADRGHGAVPGFGKAHAPRVMAANADARTRL